MSVQLHAAATLSPYKQSTESTNRRLGGSVVGLEAKRLGKTALALSGNRAVIPPTSKPQRNHNSDCILWVGE